MSRIRNIGLTVVLLLVGAISACDRNPSQKAGSAPPAATMDVVHVGYLKLLSAAPMYAAIHEGYFRDAGIDVQLTPIPSGPVGNEQLAAGAIDVAFSIVPSLIVGHVRGVPADLVTIYGATIDGPQVRDHRILVRKGSTIRSAAGLRGKKLAVVGWPGPTSDVLELLSYLARNGLDTMKVHLVGMAHPDMASALSSGVVDAAAIAEPFVTLGVASGQLDTLPGGAGYYYDPSTETEVTTYLARKAWLDAHADLARRFIAALEKGRQKAADHTWLVQQGLPTFNPKASPPIDFVQLTSDQAQQLQTIPFRAAVTTAGIERVGQQLVRWKYVPALPTDLSTLIWAPVSTPK